MKTPSFICDLVLKISATVQSWGGYYYVDIVSLLTGIVNDRVRQTIVKNLT